MNDPAAEQADWLRQLSELHGYLEGHFELTTGRHSNQFFMLARLTERPWMLKLWAERLAGTIVDQCGPISAVVGPAMGGILPAYAIGSEMKGVRVLFAEKSSDQTMVLKRGFRVDAGEPVVVVEDAVTTGSSVMKVIRALETEGAAVRAVATLVDRTAGRAALPVPLLSVVSLEIASWIPSECPLCASGMALTRPKS